MRLPWQLRADATHGAWGLIIRTHVKHVLMCTGPRCTPQGIRAEAMFGLLGQKLDAHAGLGVKRTRTHCMAACRHHGPILVVYPDGVWYHCVDEAALDRIVTEHLQAGHEVQDLIFHRLGEGDICPVENEDA